MAESFELEVVTPERLLIRESVREAHIPARNGYIGILPGHAPLLAELATGHMSYLLLNGPRRYASIHGGFMEVLPDRVRVLAVIAEKEDEIDVARAQADLEHAQQELAHPHVETDVARALSAMASAQARLAAAGRVEGVK